MRQTPVITNKGRVIAFVPNSSFLHRQPRSQVRPARTRANQSCDARQGVLGNVVHTNRDIYTATPVFTLQMHIIAKNVYKVFPSCIWGRVTSLVVCRCDLLLALPLTTLYHPPKETILRFSPTSYMALGSWVHYHDDFIYSKVRWHHTTSVWAERHGGISKWNGSRSVQRWSGFVSIFNWR